MPKPPPGAALAQVRTRHPTQRDGQVEALRYLRVARLSAIAQRVDVRRRMKALIINAHNDLRARLRGLEDREPIETCSGGRPVGQMIDPADLSAM